MIRTLTLHLTLILIAQILVCDGRSSKQQINIRPPDYNAKMRYKEAEGDCSLSQELIDEIAGYSDVANSIINTVKDGAFKGKTYSDLEKFVDKFGSRVSGSEMLEKSIDYMLDFMKERNLNVSAEEVDVPNWIRGEERAEMLSPRKKTLGLLGLGLSIGTPPEGIEAEVLVVRSFEELTENAQQAAGKIVVYNQDYVDYPETVKYRSQGAIEAAKVGAVAALVRSIASFSIYSPHTGLTNLPLPNETIPIIPTACITVEDAQLLYRLQEAGERIVISLKMEDNTLPMAQSRNAIGDMLGKEKPDEFVVVSGHIDSWDVGQGVMDDGGGMMISVNALALLDSLNLRPKRTLRAILWTSEEFGLWGARAYIERHKDELDQFKAVLESDSGTFRPLGLDFAGVPEAGCMVQEILKLLEPINATQFRIQEEVGSDIETFIQQNVPALGLNNDNGKYFWYHHTEADTMTVADSEELDLGTAVFAVASYVLADLSVELPRKKPE